MKRISILLIVVLLAGLVTACGGAEETPPPAQEEEAVEEEPAEEEEVAEEEPAEEAGPKYGGTLHVAFQNEYSVKAFLLDSCNLSQMLPQFHCKAWRPLRIISLVL